MKYISRKTHVTINLKALQHNYQNISALAPNSKTIAVIKANAYGHGAVEIAKALSKDVPAFAVAFIDEAIFLRKAGITQPILILEGAMQAEDYDLALQENFGLILHASNQVNWLLKRKNYAGCLWLKIDTGMNRLGFPMKDAENILQSLASIIEIKSNNNFILCTHCSIAENKSDPKTLKQINTLTTLAKQYQCLYSISNSSGILNWPEGHAQWNRLGLALYGSSPIDLSTSKGATTLSLKPVMSLYANIIGLREVSIGETVGYGNSWQANKTTIIATIAIGYADGYPRHASIGTPVWLNGCIVPIVGRVSMDMITIDITDLVNKNINVQLGDQVELFGENITVETVAKHCGTINYEILTCISERVTRKYLS